MIKTDLQFRDRGNVRQKLDRLADSEPQDGYPEIGETIVRLVKDSFRRERSPYGAPWKPLSTTTMQMRAKRGSSRGGILQDSRRLFNSIKASEQRGSLDVGSDVEYAGVHQFGNDSNLMFGGPRAPIPARPFLPWKHPNRPPELPDRWMDEVIDILDELYDSNL